MALLGHVATVLSRNVSFWHLLGDLVRLDQHWARLEARHILALGHALRRHMLAHGAHGEWDALGVGGLYMGGLRVSLGLGLCMGLCVGLSLCHLSLSLGLGLSLGMSVLGLRLGLRLGVLPSSRGRSIFFLRNIGGIEAVLDQLLALGLRHQRL